MRSNSDYYPCDYKIKAAEWGFPNEPLRRFSRLHPPI